MHKSLHLYDKSPSKCHTHLLGEDTPLLPPLEERICGKERRGEREGVWYVSRLGKRPGDRMSARGLVWKCSRGEDIGLDPVDGLCLLSVDVSIRLSSKRKKRSLLGGSMIERGLGRIREE